MKHLLPLLLCCLLLSILSLAGLSVYQEHRVSVFAKKTQVLAARNAKLQSESPVSPIQVTPGSILPASDSALLRNAKVRQIITTSSKKIKGDLSIYYKNLTTGETVILNGEKKYYMASLYKIIVTLYVLEREKHGELSLQEKVGSPAATLDTALTRVITESNNEYAQAIARKYGWDNIEQYIKPRFGIDFSFKSDLSSNIKTMGALFEIISEAIKLSDTESRYLLQLLNHQTRLNKLPKYLPKNIYSHNKTGEFEQYSHDAGLFYTPRANYILIFMSKTGSPDATNEQMALMSRDIYHALND